jgi:pantoate--beta-alanine ligase
MTENRKLKTINSVAEMQAFSNAVRADGKRIALVPTMGALHEGHLSLMRTARDMGDVLIASVFVNPTQFGPNEDYKAYVRNTEGDMMKMEKAGVDVAFFPHPEEIYPPGFETYVEVEEIQKPLCGRFRPGHFKGVATVVLKLFNIVKPNVAVFGQKDYQQLLVIKKMVRDLNVETEVVGLPIVREESGLAMSSRNAYLSNEEREKAVSLSRSLREIKKEFDGGETDTRTLVTRGQAILSRACIGEIDYLEIRDGETLKDKKSASPGDVADLAVRIGKARLIDNIVL